MRFKKKITKYEVFSHSEGEVLKNFKTFIKEKELNINKKVSVKFFIELTKNSYRGDIIELLEKEYLK